MEDLDLLTLNGRQLSSATLQQQYMGPWTGLYCCVLRTVTAVIDWSLKVYTQLAREGVVLTQDGDTELSLVSSSRRVAACGDSCKEAIGEINLPFLPLSVPL